MNYNPCNPNATREVRNVLNYMNELSGNGIITGQHTLTREQRELSYIKEHTGKQPALCGFELLSYSPNVPKAPEEEACKKEIEENENTLPLAWKWAEKHGLITFTWHWFSPIGGHDKSFFARNTAFDASKAVIDGTAENKALISNMDKIAEILKEFCDAGIPIIWRPFHESEGDWFWWNRSGPEIAKQLYLIMFERYTKFHNLNNLIWVWNSPLTEGYVGDDACDVISCDLYLPEHCHSAYKSEYEKLCKLTNSHKITALAEIGPILGIDDAKENRIPWAWYMTWSEVFGCSDKFTSTEELKKVYQSSYAVTLETLPELY